MHETFVPFVCDAVGSCQSARAKQSQVRTVSRPSIDRRIQTRTDARTHAPQRKDAMTTRRNVIALSLLGRTLRSRTAQQLQDTLGSIDSECRQIRHSRVSFSIQPQFHFVEFLLLRYGSHRIASRRRRRSTSRQTASVSISRTCELSSVERR